MSNAQDWLSVPQVARVLQTAPETVRAAFRRGELSGYRLGLGSKRLRIHIASVEAAIARSEHPASLQQLLRQEITNRWGTRE